MGQDKVATVVLVKHQQSAAHLFLMLAAAAVRQLPPLVLLEHRQQVEQVAVGTVLGGHSLER